MTSVAADRFDLNYEKYLSMNSENLGLFYKVIHQSCSHLLRLLEQLIRIYLPECFLMDLFE